MSNSQKAKELLDDFDRLIAHFERTRPEHDLVLYVNREQAQMLHRQCGITDRYRNHPVRVVSAR